MHKVVTLLTLACTHIISAHAQYCIEDRFTQNDYFSDDQIIVNSDISYGLADHWYQDHPQPLLNTFDIAYPDISIDPLAKKPLIVLAHGGGFWGGEKEDFTYHLQKLAKNGYVAVSINYRKGWDGDPDNCGGVPISLSAAIYCAMQDSKAALRYLVSHADDYGIDTSQIFIGGESAGAYAMMNSYYISQQEWDGIHPGFEALYGELNNAVNTISANYSIKGFISMWGGVIDTALCGKDELKPTISFYGTSDDVIPPFDGYIQYCENYDHVNGGAGLAIHLSNYDICNVLHKHEMYGHEAYEDTYTTGNIACFVKSILCEECQTKTILYEEANCDEMVLTVNDVLKNKLTVYPNPASDYAVVQLPDQLSNVEILISDMSGRSLPIQYTISGNSATLQISGLPDGMYQVRILINDKLNIGTLLVSRF